MASQYIPSGRTSIVKRGEAQFQLQTEYASVPHPRITTTIFSKGQVLHKVELAIDRAVETIEQMHHVEEIIKGQHMEVAKIIRDRGLPTQPASTAGVPDRKIRSEMIRDLPEVERVYLITPEGKLAGDRATTDEFKKLFKHIFKELPEMLNVFAALPGSGQRREEGIYEIEPGRIMLASTGVEFFLILLVSGTAYGDIAGKLKDILKS